ncbi:MAG: protein-disulfide reductase DsbD family protein [Ehrlichia sp.]
MFSYFNLDLMYILTCALIGGIILNCMPCVFPILSLKIMSVVRSAGSKNKAMVRADGIAYTMGIMVSMLVLSGILLILRYFGHLVGWGYHMQSPVFVALLMYIMFLMGLSFSGFYDLPFIFPNLISTANSRKKDGLIGSFTVGMLYTFIATPCTAPFMVSAVTVALNKPGFFSLLIFQVLGFGIALPYLLLSFFPGLLKVFPKPGKWMEVLHRFLAFPLYFSAAWLLCILIKQKGIGALFPVLSCGILLVMGIWIVGLIKTWKLIRRFIVFTCLFVVAVSPLCFNPVKDLIMRGKLEKHVTVMEFSQKQLDLLLKDKKNSVIIYRCRLVFNL